MRQYIREQAQEAVKGLIGKRVAVCDFKEEGHAFVVGMATVGKELRQHDNRWVVLLNIRWFPGYVPQRGIPYSATIGPLSNEAVHYIGGGYWAEIPLSSFNGRTIWCGEQWVTESDPPQFLSDEEVETMIRTDPLLRIKVGSEWAAPYEQTFGREMFPSLEAMLRFFGFGTEEER